MLKKILILHTLLICFFVFSQKILKTYQSPHTIAAPVSVRMLPGFHANSNDGNYGEASFVAKIGDSIADSTQPPIVHSPSSGENYIYTRSYLYPTTESNPYVPQLQNIQYFDGLGRPKQSIAIKASPTNKDIVMPTVYDSYGRQNRSYLPIPQNLTQNGEIYSQNNALVDFPVRDSGGFYQNLGDTKIYSETIFDNSPLNRINEQFPQGINWSQNSSKLDYDTNLASEAIKNFVTTTNWQNNEETTTFTISSYLSGELYKTINKDVDDNKIELYSNKLGQTILERRGDDTDTYYVYNEYGQLSFVIPPMAVEEINNNKPISTILDNLAYQYKYDYKNRLIEKKLPGKQKEYFVYNKYDKLVLYQDANLRTGSSNQTTANSWLFTKYDHLGRTTYTGITTDSRTRQDLQSFLDGQTAVHESRNNYNGVTILGFSVEYTNNVFPTNIESLLTIDYYDIYPIKPAPPVIASHIQGQKILTDIYTSSETNPNVKISTNGLPTASYIRNIEDSRWTRSYTYYDEKSRPIANYTINHMGGYTKVENVLDFAGNTKESYTYHKRLNANPVEVIIKERFVYSPQNLLIKHYHQVDNGVEELLAENQYNEMGQLISKKVGNNIQSFDYKYNIRGWLTDINNIDNIGDDLFALRLRYENPSASNPYSKKYNGNISQVDWEYKNSDGIKNTYYYKYDQLDRLSESRFKKDYGDGNAVFNLYDENLKYDKNGNITHLNRFGKHGKFNSAVQIDELEYFYRDTSNNYTNNLFKITDHKSNPLGYNSNNGINQYDANGNMVIMPDKSINTPIVYNIFNLPRVINDGNISQYTYRADGVKVNKKFTLTAKNQYMLTDYLDGFQYASAYTNAFKMALEEQDPFTIKATKASQIETFEVEDLVTEAADPPGNPAEMELKFFPIAGGFYDYQKKVYLYQYSDQVGNNRLTFYKSGNQLVTKDANDYYPFGLNHTNANPNDPVFGISTVPYNYKYQGQELQETGFYSFKWRNYDPAMGRFFNVDPLSEKYAYQSHYNFSENRVINSRELEGLEAKDNYEGARFEDRDYDGGVDYVKELANKERETGITEVVMGKLESPDFDFGSFLENQIFGISSDESWANVGDASARYWQMVADSPNATAVDNFDKGLWTGVGAIIAAPAAAYLWSSLGAVGGSTTYSILGGTTAGKYFQTAVLKGSVDLVTQYAAKGSVDIKQTAITAFVPGYKWGIALNFINNNYNSYKDFGSAGVKSDIGKNIIKAGLSSVGGVGEFLKPGLSGNVFFQLSNQGVSNIGDAVIDKTYNQGY